MKVILFTDASEFSPLSRGNSAPAQVTSGLLTQSPRPPIELDDRPVAGRRWAERAEKPAV